MLTFLHALNLTWELKYLRILYLLIIFPSYFNQPTRETKSSNTIIDDIYCNIPCPFDMCDIGILRPYISDHNAFFCILKNITLNKRTHTCSKRNFSNKNISKFKITNPKGILGNYLLS